MSSTKGKASSAAAETATGPNANNEDKVQQAKQNAQQQQFLASQRRMQQTQAQLDEVTGIMRVNVEKVLEHDHKLAQLDQQAEALQEGAAMFEKQAGSLKSKYWWHNMKMMLIMGGIGVVLLLVLYIWLSK